MNTEKCHHSWIYFIATIICSNCNGRSGKFVHKVDGRKYWETCDECKGKGESLGDKYKSCRLCRAIEKA